ncbi:molybdopterin-dependent oxidoreductase [Pedobacter sp. PAMC26386]|nr:molybdopterin-dependent oxidoreductase [Pedobacter sp. PAMC26386]
MKRQLLILLFVLIGIPSLTKAQAIQKGTSIQVGGEVTSPFHLNNTELGTFKKTLVNRKDKDGNNHVYSGVVLSDILLKAGASLGKELKGPNLNKCLLVEAADGYQVVFGLAELDKAFTDRVIILSDEMDGKPLPAADGPFRIIVQDEKKPARCIKQVTGLFVKSTVK